MSFRNIKKTISFVTLVTFFFSNFLYAAPTQNSFFKNKKIDYQKLSDRNQQNLQKRNSIIKGEDLDQSEAQKKEAQKILSSHLSDISLIHIPAELGKITDIYQNPSQDNSKLIVHIQDLHTNPEASLNLAKILEILLKDYNLGLVCSEGADGVVDTSSVSNFPDYETREKTARIFVNSGELTGEEYLSITKYPDLPIWGIENKDIYFKNIIDFNKIMKFNPGSLVFISQSKKALEELKSKIYSKELLALDQKESEYNLQKIESSDYIKYLSGYMTSLNISASRYKNITLLTETIGFEKTIDQQKIIQESQNLILNLQSAIAAKSLRNEMDSMMAKAQLFKEQKISPFSFYSYLKDLANKHLKDKFEKSPTINSFLGYLSKINSIDSSKLFVELEDLSFEIKQALSKTEEQKTLVKAIRNISFLEGFFNLKISNEELDYYLNNVESHKITFFETFLKPALKKYNISVFIDFNPDLIDKHLDELEYFYKIVKDRDIAMADNALSEIERRNSRVSALIAGGFHTKGITRILKEKGYSYIVLSPYSATEMNEANYHFLLSGQRKPIEEILKQLNLSEIVNRLSMGLRVNLPFDTDMREALIKDAVPSIAKILGISETELIPEEIINRMGLALALGRNANKWQTRTAVNVEIKSTENGLVAKVVPQKGNSSYLKITKNSVNQVRASDFNVKGNTIVAISPKVINEDKSSVLPKSVSSTIKTIPTGPEEVLYEADSISAMLGLLKKDFRLKGAGNLQDVMQIVSRDYLELNGLPLNIMIVKNRIHNIAEYIPETNTLIIDELLLDNFELLRQELLSEEFRHMLYRLLLRELEARSPTPREELIEEFYTDMRKFEDILRIGTTEGIATLIAPLIKSTDKYDFYKLLVRAIPKGQKRNDVLNILSNKGLLTDSEKKDLKELVSFGKDRDAQLSLLNAYYQNNPVVKTSLQGLVKDNAITLGEINGYETNFDKLRMLYRETTFSALEEKGKTAHYSDIYIELTKLINKNIKKYNFLNRKDIFELLKIAGQNSDKQGLVIKVLYILIEEYVWIQDVYTRRPDISEQKEQIIKEFQEDIFMPILENLHSISQRIERNDLIPDAVTLKLSEEDKDLTPTVNIPEHKRRPKVAFFALKGDPYQFGHLWSILKLLADGYDLVVTMEDNGDPDRKPELSALPLRRAQNGFLFSDVLKGFVKPLSFQAEYRRIYQSDGESVIPTLIYENREIADSVEWLYDAGYDHCNWVIDGKDGLDTPYKLMFAIEQLFFRGVTVDLTVRFQKRLADSSDTDAEKIAKLQAIQAVGKLNITEFYIAMLRDIANAEKKKKETFWRGVETFLDLLQEDMMIECQKDCTNVRAKELFNMFNKKGKEARSRENMRKWYDRFKKAVELGEEKALPEDIFNNWISLANTTEAFDFSKDKQDRYNDFRVERLIKELQKIISDVHLKVSMKVEVLDQPMDTASSNIRKKGLVHTVVSLPLIKSMQAMHFYPVYRDYEIELKDKKIGTEILGDMIDIDFLIVDSNSKLKEKKNKMSRIKGLMASLSTGDKKNEIIANILIKQSDCELLEKYGKKLLKKLDSGIKIDEIATVKEIGRIVDRLLIKFGNDEELLESKKITPTILVYHLGKYLSPLVDLKLLTERLNERIDSNAFNSVMLFKGEELDRAKRHIREELEGAHSLALHLVDGYLVKCFIEEFMFNKLAGSIKQSAAEYSRYEREARRLVDSMRHLVYERAEEITRESREIDIFEKDELNNVPGRVVLKKGPVNEEWWKQAILEKFENNPVPWGYEPIVPVKEEKGRIVVRITEDMLSDWGPDNPKGRNLESTDKKHTNFAKNSLAGLRHTMNIFNPHDTRLVKNTVERLLTAYCLGLMLKIKYNKGAYFPYQTNYGHEVRYQSDVFRDVSLRALAAMGFICHKVPNGEATAIWNTSTMGKFFDFPLSLAGTASHAESEIEGLKIINEEGSQFLLTDILAMLSIREAIFEKIKRDGYVELYLSSEDDPRITDQLYRSTHNGMYVYKEYQEKTAADGFILGLINSLDPSKIHIDCMHGAGYRTLTAFFKEMGLGSLIGKVNWMNTDERSDFGNIGKLKENPKTGKDEIFDLGADGTQMQEKVMPDGTPVKYFPVLCTADYPERFAKMPVGDIIFQTDMDNDRLYYVQILSNNAETKALLDEIGVLYNVVDKEKIAAVFIPNKSFHFLHEMNFQRLSELMTRGEIDRNRTIVMIKTLASTPAADKWAEERKKEGYKVEVVNVAVGFAKLANVMYRTEGFMREHPGEDVIITDATGKDINIGPNPIILDAWEESGGIITGVTYGFKDLLGNSFLAEREKSATESIFLSLALISKLQAEKGQVDLAKYLKELYDRDNIDTPIDFRYDNKLFTPGASAEALIAEKEGNERKNRIFGAYIAIAIAMMNKEINIGAARKILKDMFKEEREARLAQTKNKLADILIERFGQVNFDYLDDIWFTGDGVMFVFKDETKKWFVLFRPSGTEPKLKAYGFGKDRTRVAIDAWAFGFNENMTGQLPKSFTENNVLMDMWGDDGLEAVNKGRKMQQAWEDFGLVVDPEDLSVDQLRDMEKRRLVRKSEVPDNHLDLVNDWLKSQGLDEVKVDLSQPQAMPQEAIVNILKDIPEEVYKNLGTKKEDVLMKERPTQAFTNIEGDLGRGSVWGALNTFARLRVKAGDRITALGIQSERRKSGDTAWSESSVRREFADAEKLGIIKNTGTKDERGREVFEVLVSFTSEQLKTLPDDVKTMLDRGRIRSEEITRIMQAINNIKESSVETLSAEFPFSYYSPASTGFKEVVDKYYTQKINPKSNVSYVEAAEEVEKVVRVSDIERGGSFRLEDLPGLIAAVFGETVKKEDIPVIMEYFERHLGMSFNEDITKFFAILIGTGIGGQRNTTAMLTELVRLYSNREIVLYSAFGAPFEETAKNVLEKLNEAHKDITNSQKRLELLKQRKELVKFLIRAASKSGTTPETMEGFQEQIQEAIKLYSTFVYGVEQGEKFAESMINKLYDGKNFLTGGASVDSLDKDERMMFAIVLDRVILATGKYQKVQQLVDGRARTGGSMFDCFAQAMAEKLEPEFKELCIKGISKVTLYDSFGGRTQGLGPDAFINIAMALVGPEIANPIERLVDAARPVAARHTNIEDRGLFGKRLAAFARGIGAEYMYIGLPTTIEKRVADSFQQLIGESIDVGGLVGYPTGMKAVVHPTTVLADKSIHRKDGSGKRLYLLITDQLADAATKTAEEKIIKEQMKKGNYVVRLEIKDHSPEEVIKLFYELMNFVEWYGNFVASEVLANLANQEGVVKFMCDYAQEKGSKLMPEDIKDVDFNDTEIANIITTLYSEEALDKNDPKYAYYLALRKVLKDLNPWFQPGVEWGKTAAKAIAEKLFVKDGKYTEVADPVSGKNVKIPVRDENMRREFWEAFGAVLKKEGGAYIVGGEICQTNEKDEYVVEEIKADEAPGIVVNDKYTLNDVKKQIKEISRLKEEQQRLLDKLTDKGDYLILERRKKHDALQQKIEGEIRKLIDMAGQVVCNEGTAQGIAVAAYDAHAKGLGITFSLYAGRQGFEKVNFEDFAARLSCIDTFNNSPDGQHTDRDGVVAGTKGTLEILAYVNETHGRKVVADGMIAPYWDGLTPQELIYINYKAYLEVYEKRKIDHFDLRLEGRTEDDIAKIFVLFAQANRIYSELNKQNRTVILGNPGASSRNSL